MEATATRHGERLVHVLEADPDLAQQLDPLTRNDAVGGCRARTVTLPPGRWGPSADAATRGAFGLLVLQGLLVRDVLLNGNRCSELVGSGDVIEPRDSWQDGRLVPVEVEWAVMEETTVAVLDDGFLAAAAQWPGVLAAVFSRASERSFRLGTRVAICQLGRVDQRIQALLWHLAERWGRVSHEGIVLRLPLSHAALGRLVGAQRPTVTLALKELALRGSVARRSDGSFLLREPVAAGLDGSPQPR
jgi:hypothetical protein